MTEEKFYSDLIVILVTGKEINIKCDGEKAIEFFINFQGSKTWDVISVVQGMGPQFVFRCSEIAMISVNFNEEENKLDKQKIDQNKKIS